MDCSKQAPVSQKKIKQWSFALVCFSLFPRVQITSFPNFLVAYFLTVSFSLPRLLCTCCPSFLVSCLCCPWRVSPLRLFPCIVFWFLYIPLCFLQFLLVLMLPLVFRQKLQGDLMQLSTSGWISHELLLIMAHQAPCFSLVSDLEQRLKIIRTRSEWGGKGENFYQTTIDAIDLGSHFGWAGCIT